MEDIRYVENDGVHLAYEVVGGGPPEVMFVPMWFSNLDLLDDFPPIAEGIEGFSAVGRVVLWDRRGSGLSDRSTEPADLDTSVSDLIAVLDAAGIEKVALFGFNESGMLAVRAAAEHPDRFSHLIIYGSYATTVRKDDYPWAPEEGQRAEEIAWLVRGWGTREAAQVMMAGGDERAVRWAMKWMRNSVARERLVDAFGILASFDVRADLERIRIPTLVLHRADDMNVPVHNGRYIASKIPGARYVEFPGFEHSPFLGDWETIAGEIEEFLTGRRRPRVTDRVLATIVFTDIVDSTQKAGQLGDHRWRTLLDSYDVIVRECLDRYGGRLVKFTGDGSLATFDSPARSIEAAQAIRDRVSDLGVEIRAGIHTGELELRGDDVGGIAVHIAARVMDQADAREVLVSAAVPPLVTGSGLEFTDRGERDLKGVEGPWKLYAAGSGA